MPRMGHEEVRAILYLYDERQWLRQLVQSGLLDGNRDAVLQVARRQAAIDAKIAAIESGEPAKTAQDE